jgi:hypothetical protein
MRRGHEARARFLLTAETTEVMKTEDQKGGTMVRILIVGLVLTLASVAHAIDLTGWWRAQVTGGPPRSSTWHRRATA